MKEDYTITPVRELQSTPQYIVEPIDARDSGINILNQITLYLRTHSALQLSLAEITYFNIREDDQHRYLPPTPNSIGHSNAYIIQLT